MKRFVIAFSAILLVAVLSGCSIVSGVLKRVLPGKTATAELPAISDSFTATPPESSPVSTQVSAPDTPSPEPTVAMSTANPNGYASASLGIAFTVPESWTGKYRVEEYEGGLSVYFKPQEPLTEETGDGWFFLIERKSKDTADKEEFLDGLREVEVNGVTYICGGPTDVSYQGPEFDTFIAMTQDTWAIFDTIRAAN